MSTFEYYLEKIADESLPLATKAQHSRQALLHLVVEFKTQIRQYLEHEAHLLEELKSLPSPVGGKFRNRRIAEQRRWIERRLQMIEDRLISCGEQVWTSFDLLDCPTQLDRLTLHEKAQLLDVPYNRLEQFERKKRDTALAALVLQRIERDGEAVPGGEGMPFFEALSRYRIKILMAQMPFKQRRATLERFAGRPIPYYEIGYWPDGRCAMFEIRSPLKAIDPDGTERARERKRKFIGFVADDQEISGLIEAPDD